MTYAGSLKVTTPSEREIAMSRVFDAPRSLVFEALTRPELVKRWLGVHHGFTLEVCEIDLRVGGAYRYVWHGPDGVVMGMRGTYVEIVAPERIVTTEKFDESWYPGEAVGTLSLAEQDGQTTLTLNVLYESREARDFVLKTPMKEGVEAGYDQLAVVLSALQAA